MPSYKLTYFNARGRAEAARLLFAAAGVEFEDIRVDSDKWKQLKPSAKIGILPCLEVDGQSFTQSRAICYFLAKEFGFYPSSNLGGIHVDEAVFIIEDFFQAAMKARFAPEEKKAEMGKEFAETGMPKFLSWLEKLLKASNTGFFYGDKMTIADIVAYDFLSAVETNHPGSLDSSPLVKALVEKIGNQPKIKSYVEKRPVTSF